MKFVLYLIPLFVAFPDLVGQMTGITIKQLSFFVFKNQAIGASQSTQFYAKVMQPEILETLKKPP